MATHTHTNLMQTASAVRNLQSSDATGKKQNKTKIARNDCKERDYEHRKLCTKDTGTNG